MPRLGASNANTQIISRITDACELIGVTSSWSAAYLKRVGGGVRKSCAKFRGGIVHGGARGAAGQKNCAEFRAAELRGGSARGVGLEQVE